MYNLRLSAEQLEIRDTVRDFVAQEIKPVALKADRLEAADPGPPLELLNKASQMGLRTLALSEEAGGAGADTLTACIVAEELAAGDVNVAAPLVETSVLGHLLFDQAMTPDQRERFLPPFLADDQFHLAIVSEGMEGLGLNYHRPVVSEHHIDITGGRDGNGDWVVNGASKGVANGPLAKLLVVQVKAESKGGLGGVSTLLVPRDTAGLTVRETDRAENWSHGSHGDVIFKDCRLPAANVLDANASPLAGTESIEGFAPQFVAMNLGVGRAAYEAALDYAQLRVQGGRRIVEHQAIGAKLADMAIKLEAARAALWQAAWASDHPEAVADRSIADAPLLMMAQVFTAEAVYEVSKLAAEVFGAMGVMKDMPLQKYVHDALAFVHARGGVSDTKLRIAEALAGYRRGRPHMAAA